MAGSVHVQVARLPEREELMRALEGRGFSPRPSDDVDRLGIEIPCGGDPGRLCDELLRELEEWISETGLALVPVKAEDRLFLRPPSN